MMRTWHGAEQLVELEADSAGAGQEGAAARNAAFCLRATADGNAMLSPRHPPPPIASAGASAAILASLGGGGAPTSLSPGHHGHAMVVGAPTGRPAVPLLWDDATRPSISHALPSILSARLPGKTRPEAATAGQAVPSPRRANNKHYFWPNSHLSHRSQKTPSSIGGSSTMRVPSGKEALLHGGHDNVARAEAADATKHDNVGTLVPESTVVMAASARGQPRESLERLQTASAASSPRSGSMLNPLAVSDTAAPGGIRVSSSLGMPPLAASPRSSVVSFSLPSCSALRV